MADPRWDGDMLGRHESADYLTKLVEVQFGSKHAASSGAFCLAIDGDWGTGKSFFIERWSKDLASAQYPVVRFDAWVNDLADDPLLGFMAALDQSLSELSRCIPTVDRVGNAAGSRMEALKENAAKAILPALAVVGKGVLKKLTGVDADDLAAAGDADMTDVAEVGAEGLGAFFEAALTAHRSKQAAILGLKKSIEGLLADLEKHSKYRLPMFILVDELDRCRPDYAIRLLEGVKHLFDARGLCFVFSTNLAQLKESARAVYGPGFDGYRYLKRFFSIEYRLPEPDAKAFARHIVSQSTLCDGRLKYAQTLPHDYPTPIDGLVDDFSTVAAAFRLDLRSQQQVLKLADLASVGLSKDSQLYALYLFALAATYQLGAGVFDKSRSSAGLVLAISDNIDDVDVKFRHFNSENGRPTDKSVTLKQILGLMDKMAGMTIEELTEYERSARGGYPNSLASDVFSNSHIGVPRKRNSPASSLNVYSDCVRNAGQTFRREVREQP